MRLRLHTSAFGSYLFTSLRLKARRVSGSSLIVALGVLALILVMAFQDVSGQPVKPQMQAPQTVELNIGHSWNHAPLSGQQPSWYAAH